MRLFIAEKPKMGRAIAECLPGRLQNEKTHVTVGSDVVTWCIGHILQTAMPEHYNPEWKSWSLDHLPIIPERMELVPNPDTKSQLMAIKKLLKECDEIVHAGDPGREGQMIVDEVLEYLGNRKPVKRLLLNATDAATIKKQLQKLEDNRNFALVYEEAKCRSYADWLVGMNLSRAATKTIAGVDTTLSIGRVQTAALALVVNRCKTIENFVPRSFYDIEAKVETKNGSLILMKYAPGTEELRIWDKDKAQSLMNGIEGKTGNLKVENQRKSVAPPKLFHLGSLQNEAGKKLKLSATEVLAHAQTLYEMGCLTYPRTECNYLPEEQANEVNAVAKAIGDSDDELMVIINKMESPFLIRKNIFNNKSMEGEEHHAIIPTGKPLPSNVTGVQRSLYNLVAKRYLMMLHPNYEYDETVISLPLSEITLKAKGSIPAIAGWKAVDGSSMTEKLLPPVTDGEKGKVLKSRLVEGKTTPPDYYLEGVLVDEEMGGIAKYVTDPKIKSVLKETSGIGTAATRAGIIEVLKKRGYIWVNKSGHVLDTKMGRALIEALPSKLTTPDMTAKWEIELKQISSSKLPSSEFKRGIEEFVSNGVRWFISQQGKLTLTFEKMTQSKTSPAKRTSKTGIKKTPSRRKTA